MKTRQLTLIALAGAVFGLAAHAADAARRLIEIKVPQHDPLYLDTATLKRTGTTVSFKYLLDVLSPPDEDAKPREWRSNEIEASIDCRSRTVVVRRLVAYSGPRGTGAATAVHSFMAPGVKPEPIEPKSTFAYLESHVCRGG